MSKETKFKTPNETLFDAIDSYPDPDKAADIVISVICSYLAQSRQEKLSRQPDRSENVSLALI